MVDTCCTPAAEKVIREIYPDIDFSFTHTIQSNPHVVAAVVRQVQLEDAMSKAKAICRNTLPPGRRGATILVVGGSIPRFHAMFERVMNTRCRNGSKIGDLVRQSHDHTDLHVGTITRMVLLTPVLSPKDYARNLMYSHLTAPGFSTINTKLEDLDKTFLEGIDIILFPHSMYYIHPHHVAAAMSCTSSKNALSVHHDFYRFAGLGPQSWYKVDGVGQYQSTTTIDGLVRAHAAGDGEEFVHQDLRWTSQPSISTPYGKLANIPSKCNLASHSVLHHMVVLPKDTTFQDTTPENFLTDDETVIIRVDCRESFKERMLPWLFPSPTPVTIPVKRSAITEMEKLLVARHVSSGCVRQVVGELAKKHNMSAVEATYLMAYCLRKDSPVIQATKTLVRTAGVTEFSGLVKDIGTVQRPTSRLFMTFVGAGTLVLAALKWAGMPSLPIAVGASVASIYTVYRGFKREPMRAVNPLADYPHSSLNNSRTVVFPEAPILPSLLPDEMVMKNTHPLNTERVSFDSCTPIEKRTSPIVVCGPFFGDALVVTPSTKSTTIAISALANRVVHSDNSDCIQIAQNWTEAFDLFVPLCNMEVAAAAYDYDYDGWFANQKPNVRKEIAHRLSAGTMESPDLAKTFYRKSFIKAEKFVKLCVDKIPFNARFIQGVGNSANFYLGPYIHSLTAPVKSAMPENYHMTSGMSNLQIGRIMSNAYYNGRTCALSIDRSSFDSTVARMALVEEFKFYARLAQPNYVQSRALQAQLDTVGYLRDGIRYTMPGMRKSGDPNTTLGNTLVALVSTHYTLRHIGIKDPVVLAAGDDMIIMFDPSVLDKSPHDVFQQYVDHQANTFGFVTTGFATDEPVLMDFLSCHPLPTTELDNTGVPSWVLAPHAGRYCTKIFSTLSMPPDAAAHAAAIIQGSANVRRCNPLIDYFMTASTRVLPPGTIPSGWRDPDAIYKMSFCEDVVLNLSLALEWLETRYQVDPLALKRHVNYHVESLYCALPTGEWAKVIEHDT